MRINECDGLVKEVISGVANGSVSGGMSINEEHSSRAGQLFNDFKNMVES